MIKICTHIKFDGVRCGSPAMRGNSRCYFHLKQHYREKPRRQSKRPPRMASGVVYVFQALERHTTDEVLSTEQLAQVYKQAQRAMRRHLERLKRRLQPRPCIIRH